MLIFGSRILESSASSLRRFPKTINPERIPSGKSIKSISISSCCIWFKKPRAQTSWTLDFNWPIFPKLTLPINALTTSSVKVIVRWIRDASCPTNTRTRSTFSDAGRFSKKGSWILIGMRRVKVSNSVELGSSVVAPTIRTFAWWFLPVSPKRLNVPWSIK